MENDFYNRFSSIIKECNYDNTYKMAWAKAIVEICCERSDGTSNLEISLFDIAQKFIKYYWNQIWFYDYKQSDNYKRPPAVVSLVKDLIKEYKNKLCINCGLNFHDISPVDFEKAKIDFNKYSFNDIYHKYISKIVSVLKFNVSWRFDSFANTANQLYSYSKKADFLIIKKEDVQIIKENSFDLITVILIRWAMIIKNFNSSSKTKKIIVPYNFVFQELKNNIFEELLIFENEQLKTFINTKYVSTNDNLDNKLPKIVEDWIEFIESENFVKPQTFKFAYIISILDEIKKSQYVKKSGLLSIPFIYHSIFEKYWKPLFEYKFIQTESNDNNFLYDNVYNYFKDCLLPKHSSYTFGHFLYVNHHLYHFLEIKPDKITHEFSNLGLLEYKNLWVIKQSSYMHNNFVVKNLDLYFNEEQLYVLGQYNNLLQKLAYYKWAQLLAKFNKISNFSELEFYDDYINFKTNLINTFFASKRLSSNKTRTNEINNIEDIYLLISSSSLYRNIKVNNIFENNKNVTSIPRISKTKQVMLQNEHDNENFKTLDNFINNTENEKFVNNKIKEELSIKSKQCNNIFYKINDDGVFVYSNYKFNDDGKEKVINKNFKLYYASNDNCLEKDEIIISTNILSSNSFEELFSRIPIELKFVDKNFYEIVNNVNYLAFDFNNYNNYLKYFNDSLINSVDFIDIIVKGDHESLYWVYLYFVSLFSCFGEYEIKNELKNEIFKIINDLPFVSSNINLCKLFENNISIFEHLKTDKILKVEDFKKISILYYSSKELNYIKNKLEWILFNNPVTLVNDVLNTLAPAEMYVIKERYLAGEKIIVLDEIAGKLNLTRERIRQIEQKAFNKLKQPSRNKKLRNIYQYIYLFSNNDYYISMKIIDELNLKSILNLISKIYDDVLTMASFVFEYDNGIRGKLESLLAVQTLKWKFQRDEEIEDIYEQLSMMLTNLPKVIFVNELESIIDNLKLQLVGEINEEDLCFLVRSLYFDYGEIFSKDKLTEGEILKYLISIYFSKGIYIYDEKNLNFIRTLLRTKFNISTDISDHALSAKISRECYLYDKGTYFYTDKNIISGDLANEIYQYMIENQKDTYFDALLYSIFEVKLKNEGVNNRYLMKSALRQYFESNLVFFKDYIGFTSNKESIYNQIEKYIKESKNFITIEDIKDKFPGVSDAIINAVSCRDGIVSFFGKYIYIDNLDLTYEEKDIIYEKLVNLVSDNRIHHMNELFSILSIKHSQILEKCHIEYQNMLFSLVEELYKGYFELNRPYVAKKGIDILEVDERLKNYVIKFDEISIDQIKDYANKENLSINSILKLVDSLSNSHILKNADSLIAIEKVFDNNLLIKQVINIVDRVVYNNKIVTSSAFGNYLLFPDICEWNEWILYSLVNKYSDKVIAITDNRQFRYRSGSIAAKVIFIDKSLNIDSYDELIKYLQLNNKSI